MFEKIKKLFRREKTFLEKLEDKIQQNAPKEEIMHDLAYVFADICYVFHNYTKRTKDDIQKYNANIPDIKQAIEAMKADNFSDKIYKDIKTSYLKMYKNTFNELQDYIGERNQYIKMATIAFVPKILRLQEKFPEDDWLLENIQKRACQKDIEEEVMNDVIERTNSIGLSTYNYPTPKEMKFVRLLLITTWLTEYGSESHRNLNIYNENGLVWFLCFNFNGTYTGKKNGRVYTFDELLEIRKSGGKLFEEDIFADFIEVDYEGVV